MNSVIYCSQEADNYFERNKDHGHSYFIDYLLQIFPRGALGKIDIAEFGIGNGQNLIYLKEFCNKCHGYEASESAVCMFKKNYEFHPQKKDFHVQKVNLAEPFSCPHKYDLIIYGFFPYYVDDEEMDTVKKNTLDLLKPDSYIYIFDFLVKNNKVKIDSRNRDLKVYKRNLTYWLNFFDDFDLMDFRLFDSSRTNHYVVSDNLNKIDLEVSDDEDQWYFAGLFRKKRK